MSCPDELTLELWSADALPRDEAASVAAHVRTCSMCSARLTQWAATGASLSASLELDQDERAYLASLKLPAAWRKLAEPAPDSRWGWLALLVVVAAFFAWTLAGGPLGEVLNTANQVGLVTVLATNAVGLLLGIGEAVVEAAMQPRLSLSQPVLAVLALVLLFWPRIWMKSAPHTLQGVRS